MRYKPNETREISGLKVFSAKNTHVLLFFPFPYSKISQFCSFFELLEQLTNALNSQKRKQTRQNKYYFAKKTILKNLHRVLEFISPTMRKNSAKVILLALESPF